MISEILMPLWGTLLEKFSRHFSTSLVLVNRCRLSFSFWSLIEVLRWQFGRKVEATAPVHCRYFSGASLSKLKKIFCDFDDKICIAALQNVHGSRSSSDFQYRTLFIGEMGPQTQKIVARWKTGNSRVIITPQEMCRRSNIRECFEVNVL